MLARVTILGRGPRGFLTLDRGTVMVEPGASALLDLADHPAHDAWVAAGEVSIEVGRTAAADPDASSRVSERAGSTLLPPAGEGVRAPRGRMRGTSA